MSSSRFLQSFLLSLVLPVMAYAAVPRTEAGRMPGLPGKAEKFILKPDATPAPTPVDGPEAKEKAAEKVAEKVAGKAAEKTEAAHAGEHPVIVPKVDLNVAQRQLFIRSSGSLSLLEKSYLDVYSILHESNACSQFFGGPRISTGVLNALYPRLKKTSFGDSLVGISMFGQISYVTDMQTGAYYRLFDEVVVNENGPFYQSMKSPTRGGFFHNVGHFQANTREARAAMLLHELGHLLTDSEQHWLLPDDGGDETQSLANTRVIMEKCGAQIKSLSDNH